MWYSSLFANKSLHKKKKERNERSITFAVAFRRQTSGQFYCSDVMVMTSNPSLGC